MAKVIFFDDIDFGLLKDGSDEVSTSGKWLDNGIYFTNPKSENEQSKPHHIAHDSYIYTLGSNVKPGDEYELETTDSSYYISVISSISANPFEKEIKYSTTKYDLSGIFEDISNMKQQILDILGRLNRQETVSSFTFSLSRTGITDNSFKNFVVGEPILAKITSITPSSGKYSNFNIIQSDDIVKIDHTVSDEDSFYFNTAKSTSVRASIMTGSENSSITSTINDVTVSYAPIYTYPYSCGVRVARLNNVNINTSSPGISLQSKFTDIQSIIFNKLKDTPVETESNIANKKLSDYYNVNSYKVYYNNSYTTTTGTPSLLTYAIKQQNKSTFINTSVELNVKAYLVSYTVKTENPNSIGTYNTETTKYAYITDITNATVNQYLGSNKTSYTCQNTCNGTIVTGGSVASLPFATNKPHRKDILITYTLVKPNGISVTYADGTTIEEQQLNLNVGGEPVQLKAALTTLNNNDKLHDSLKGITVDVTGGIRVDTNTITSGGTITVTATGPGSGSITFKNSKITTVNKTINVNVNEVPLEIKIFKKYDKSTQTMIEATEDEISNIHIYNSNDTNIKDGLPTSGFNSSKLSSDFRIFAMNYDFEIYGEREDETTGKTVFELIYGTNDSTYENKTVKLTLSDKIYYCIQEFNGGNVANVSLIYIKIIK